MDTRDEWLARTFVELADTLVADFDLIDFLSLLAERCVELLEVAEVGLALADSRGRLQVLASSTERMRTAELIEVQNGDGPCLECYRTGLPILNKRLDEAGDRWPRFSPVARQSGFVMVHALPLRLRSDVIGALNVFDVAPHEIPRSKVHLTQALADVATIGILQERTVKQRTDLSVQLESALNSSDRHRAGQGGRGRAIEGRHGRGLRAASKACPAPATAVERRGEQYRGWLPHGGRSPSGSLRSLTWCRALLRPKNDRFVSVLFSRG